ncbi:hypothetical protein RUND412_006508 [Rhizina undulata]
MSHQIVPAPSPPLTITAVPLTPASFAPFGSVIQRPPATAGRARSSTTVNQGTAQKHPKISSFTSSYHTSPSSKHAEANVNLFVCSPRALIPSGRDREHGGKGGGFFKCVILERHPYTSQTFIPLGLPAQPVNSDNPSRYLVIVAPNIEDEARGNPPDLERLKAFVCHGFQAVTYAPGTWHAPMVALGERPIEFVVLVHENGVEGEDTQEVHIDGDGVGVRVLGLGEAQNGLWAQPKL